MNPAVSLPGDGAAHGVGHPDQQRPLFLTVTQSQQGVRSLSGLRDEETNVVPEYRGLPVQKVRGEINHDGKLRELLQYLPGRYAGVVGGPTANKQESPTPPDLRDEGLGGEEGQLSHVGQLLTHLDTAEDDDLLLEVDPPPHGVDYGLGLLEYFLLHEGGEVSLHDLLDLHLEGGDLPPGAASALLQPGGDPVNGQLPLTHRSHVVVLQVDDPVGVLHDGAGVAGKEVLGGVVLPQWGELSPGAVSPQQTQTGFSPPLVFTVEYRDVVRGQAVGSLDAHEERGAPPGGHGLPGVKHGLEDQSEGALQLLGGLLHQLSEGEGLPPLH